MTLAEACGWAFARGAVLAIACLPIAWAVVLRLSQADRLGRRLMWAALFVPYFSPELLVGYSYANFSRMLVHHPYLNEAVYSLAVLIKFLPVAAVVLYFSPPPPVSAEAFFCRRLALGAVRSRLAGLCGLVGFWLRGPARAFFPAWAVVFLLTFQEFEIASLMGKSAGVLHTPKAWTVWLFDKQTGGLFLADSLRLVLVPLCIELLVLGSVLCVAWLSGPQLAGGPAKRGRTLGLWGKWAVSVYLAAAALLVAIVPLVMVLGGTWSGWIVLWNDFTLTSEMAASASLAIVCAIGAWFAAGALLGAASRFGRGAWIAVCAVSIPGLLGSLVLSLAILQIFQSDLLAALSETPIRVVLAVTLLLLPRAILLGLLLRAIRPAEPIYLARLLRAAPSAAQRDSGRNLFWELSTAGHFWALVVLFVWAYWELTAPALLAPPTLVTAAQRLYNLMHYGRTAVLSAMLAATIAFPLLLLLLAGVARRPVLRWLLP
jgi:ABC-type Fe3+ transport system permease subunit